MKTYLVTYVLKRGGRWEVSAWSRIAPGAGMYPVKRMFVQLDNTTSGRQLWTEADSEAELAWKLTRIMERI